MCYSGNCSSCQRERAEMRDKYRAGGADAADTMASKDATIAQLRAALIKAKEELELIGTQGGYGASEQVDAEINAALEAGK